MQNDDVTTRKIHFHGLHPFVGLSSAILTVNQRQNRMKILRRGGVEGFVYTVEVFELVGVVTFQDPFDGFPEGVSGTPYENVDGGS